MPLCSIGRAAPLHFLLYFTKLYLCLIYITNNIIGSSEAVSTLVIYIPEVFFADRKLHADFGTVVIYPTSRVRGFPNKHRAPEYEFTASSTLQTFTFPQFKLFLYSFAKQIYVNMPFNFLFRNSYYSCNIYESPQINVYVALWVHYF